MRRMSDASTTKMNPWTSWKYFGLKRRSISSSEQRREIWGHKTHNCNKLSINLFENTGSPRYTRSKSPRYPSFQFYTATKLLPKFLYASQKRRISRNKCRVTIFFRYTSFFIYVLFLQEPIATGIEDCQYLPRLENNLFHFYNNDKIESAFPFWEHFELKFMITKLFKVDFHEQLVCYMHHFKQNVLQHSWKTNQIHQ